MYSEVPSKVIAGWELIALAVYVGCSLDVDECTNAPEAPSFGTV